MGPVHCHVQVLAWAVIRSISGKAIALAVLETGVMSVMA